MAIPPLADTDRITHYTPSASSGPFDVVFHLYGTADDYENWIEVWLDGVQLAKGTQYTLDSPSGSLLTLPRPITDARITLTAPATGDLYIIGADRPHRDSQFTEGVAVPAASQNRTLSGIVARLREMWDFMRGRVLRVAGGETVSQIPRADLRASKILGFDATGQVSLFDPSPIPEEISQLIGTDPVTGDTEIRVGGVDKLSVGAAGWTTNYPGVAARTGQHYWSTDDGTGAVIHINADNCSFAVDEETGDLQSTGAVGLGMSLWQDDFNDPTHGSIAATNVYPYITFHKSQGNRNAPVKLETGDILGTIRWVAQAESGLVNVDPNYDSNLRFAAGLYAQITETTVSSENVGADLIMRMAGIGLYPPTETFRFSRDTGFGIKSTGSIRQLRQIITEAITDHRTITWTVNNANRAINLNQDLVLTQGTWTPAISFATAGDLSVAYASQSGTWFRTGNRVKAAFSISTNTFTHSTASGNLEMTGLGSVPLVAVSSMYGNLAHWRGVTKANYTQIGTAISTSTITFIASGSGQAHSNISAADMPSGGTVLLRGYIEFLLA